MARFWRSLIVLAGLSSLAAAAIPNYYTSPKPADSTGVTSTAAQLAKKMRHGINIGNTLEATGGETNWGNPKITKAYVDFVKSKGFNAIRLPVAWNQHADASTAKIDPTWMARVKEVVDYCVKDGLYVFMNIHWDGGWLEEHCTPDKQQENNAKQKAYWQQIATTFRDYDEHVLFASANEPNVANAEQMSVLLSYHQTFIDAVRSTGGKNANRALIIQGPNTDFEKTYNLMNTMPKDTVPNKLFVEVHYYTPWNFCGLTEDASWGKMFYYWGKPNHSPTDTSRNPTWGEEEDLNKFFNMIKTKFVDKGIPAIVGEFGVEDRKDKLSGDSLKLHEASRAYFLKSVTQKAFSLGMVPFFWEKGQLFDRANLKVLDQQSYEGLMAGAGASASTPASDSTPAPTSASTTTPTNTSTPAPVSNSTLPPTTTSTSAPTSTTVSPTVAPSPTSTNPDTVSPTVAPSPSSTSKPTSKPHCSRKGSHKTSRN